MIVKVDELTGEIEIVREELNAMQQSRTKLRQRISELEDELKKVKEQVKQQSECLFNSRRVHKLINSLTTPNRHRAGGERCSSSAAKAFHARGDGYGADGA